jgi:hypothetical protein
MTDDTAALQDQLNRSGANAHIELGKGVHHITSKIHVKDQRVNLHGYGLHATTVLFNPVDDPQAEKRDGGYICFEFSAGHNVLYQCSLTDMSFFSDDSAKTKFAVDLVDFSNFKLDRVSVGGSVVTPQGVCAWTGGTGSVALRTRGRELLEANNLSLTADRPIQFSKNPNYGHIDCDHFHFEDTYLIGNGKPLIAVDDNDIRITQMLFDGYQSWCLGTDGFHWTDTKSRYVSNGLTFKNVRREQEEVENANLVWVEHNTSLQNLALEACYTGSKARGIYLRNVYDLTLTRHWHVTQPGTCALDIDESVGHTDARNCFWQDGTTASLVRQNMVWSIPKPRAAAPLPRSFILEAA